MCEAAAGYTRTMCTVEIRPGRGGQDAERFAGRLADSVLAWASRRGEPGKVTSASARMVTVSLPRTPAAAFR